MLAVPAAAQTYLISLQGQAFAPPSANPIAEVQALGGLTVNALFQVDTSAATFQSLNTVGGVGQAAFWTGSVQAGIVTIGNSVLLLRNGNDLGNILLTNNVSAPFGPNARQDQANITSVAGLSPAGAVRTYDIFGLSPDIYMQSLFFGRTAPGTTDVLPLLITDVTQRPDFPSLMFSPFGNPLFLGLSFRQGNPTTSAQQLALPGQQLNVGNLIINVQEIGGSVPEPSSWAMLIAGFGLVGAAARRRRVVAAA
ncbi:PEPxxWA-CTERM sorting domain-containing protein [Sandarakinorhabdus rubra]|uniref:PEPxxWA-CTERM sorting domain-containing protein n=1 Tax=Sandarakinorhabdus rubra TaxID=2672568 RepID=UPI001F3C7DD7|nr:PEPxxWA-CTERM sorting domain-containing protein [Sandarakinorhabdus rubra]